MKKLLCILILFSTNLYSQKSEIRKEYVDYCKKNKVKPVSDRHIKNFLESEFAADTKQKYVNKTGVDERVWAWEGIKLK